MKRLKNRRAIAAIVLAAVLVATLSLTCCRKGRYLLHVSVGEARLLLKREPIDELIAKGKLKPEEIEKIKLIREAKSFAANDMGFGPSDNYESYVKIDRRAVSYALIACPSLSLKPLTYNFPIAGEVSYLGFFNLRMAQEWEERLIKKGYDTHVGDVAAFSTLGYFEDPVTSTMLKYRPSVLVNLIIHELAHSALYIPGQPEFNENSATFLGNEGALEFLHRKFGPESKEVKFASDLKLDEKAFSEVMKGVAGELEGLYSGKLNDSEKLKEKGRILDTVKVRVRAISFRTSAYENYPTLELNNAIIYSYLLYQEDLSLFESLYKSQGKDLKKTYKLLKSIEDKKGDPFEHLKKAIQD